ncbi:unnamed protein product [Laminaria digitata]
MLGDCLADVIMLLKFVYSWCALTRSWTHIWKTGFQPNRGAQHARHSTRWELAQADRMCSVRLSILVAVQGSIVRHRLRTKLKNWAESCLRSVNLGVRNMASDRHIQ